MPIHVLAVDDEAHTRRLVQLNLERCGYRVSMAADGVEALERIGEDRPDVVVADITMPRMDGIELLRRIKADPETAGIPVILLTAKSQDADIFEGRRSGAEDYLPKPFSPTQLVNSVAEAVKAHSPDAPREGE